MSTRVRSVTLVLAFVGFVVVATAGMAAPAVAGDNIAIFTLNPSEADAETGETIEIDLVVSTHGDLVGDGIDELSATLSYDADVFSVAEVTHDEMLAAGNPDAEVVGSADVDDDDGQVTISQERDPPGDGATTAAPAATIAFEVAPDAPTANETIEITDASAFLVSDYPQGTLERDATISIEAVENPDNSSAIADAVPGFGSSAAVVAGLAAVALYVVRREK
ncbi:cohesin domain-containing protein [Natronobacterium texcoconense]|uniref:Cohesin domain-containing protein n=1 Tax=Natronobacterium texcoconense TaxID=1095778 RepID=A0A1H1IWV4_NATTX|nr:cohesin domain-containing protein [Natronobacterium texcoconense]SDR42173.1 Cohesin domain-containing protein [Natronobacterium texcoconense]